MREGSENRRKRDLCEGRLSKWLALLFLSTWLLCKALPTPNPMVLFYGDTELVLHREAVWYPVGPLQGASAWSILPGISSLEKPTWSSVPVVL